MRSDADRQGRGGLRRASIFTAGPWLSGAAIVLVAVIVLAGGFFGVRALLWRDIALPSAEMLAAQASAEASSAAAASGGLVEVPKVLGLRADEALVILKAAGLKVAFEATGAPVSSPASRTVSAQIPSAGTVISMSTTVTLTAPSLLVSAGATPTAAVVAAPQPGAGFVVCIDPGHQAHFNAKLEPIGPGSKILKPRMTGGLSGVESGVPEYELALQISTNLKHRLEAEGVRVVMTRTTNDVDLTNIQRAAIANRADADVFIRIHATASTDASASGVASVFAAKTQWTKKTWAASQRAARAVQAAVVHETSAVNAGVTGAQSFAGFNWAKMPSLMVEVGFLSNPVEDRLLSSPSYQDKVASGIAQGLLAYLDRERR